MAFLDETGLQTLWTKIKNTFALKTHSHSASQVSGLATVASTGSYNDLSNKPTIPEGATVDSALNSSSTNPVQNQAINAALATKVTSAQAIQAVSGAGYATSANASAITSSFVSAGGYVTSTYVSGATVTSAGTATSATNAGTAASCTGNAATATNASSLGGLTSAGYVQTGNVDQTVSGTKSFVEGVSASYFRTSSTANPMLQCTWSDVDITATSRSAAANKLHTCILDKNGVRFGGIESTANADGSNEQHYTMRNHAKNAWLNDFTLKEDASGNISAIIAHNLHCKTGIVSCYATSANASVYVDNGFTDSKAHKGVLHTNTNGAFGVYDTTKAKWLLISDSAGNVTMSGNATTATTATTASKIGTATVGGVARPVYISAGVPTQISYTISKSVPADAEFTDTVYTHPTTAGNKHIPSGGAANNVLVYSAAGTAKWAASVNSATHATSAGTATTCANVSIQRFGSGTAVTLPASGTWTFVTFLPGANIGKYGTSAGGTTLYTSGSVNQNYYYVFAVRKT